jgi:glycogen operon protein
MLAIVLLSAGTPMIMMGDEVHRTQLGNNNAYCQDNVLTWLDWSLLEKHADLLRFVNHLVRFRVNFERSRETEAFSLADLLRQRQIQWHGVKPSCNPIGAKIPTAWRSCAWAFRIASNI